MQGNGVRTPDHRQSVQNWDSNSVRLSLCTALKHHGKDFFSSSFGVRPPISKRVGMGLLVLRAQKQSIASWWSDR